jgi:hypothetical protein
VVQDLNEKGGRGVSHGGGGVIWRRGSPINVRELVRIDTAYQVFSPSLLYVL